MAAIVLVLISKCRAQGLYKNLLTRENPFDLLHFEEFTKKAQYELLIDLCLQLLSKITLFFKKIVGSQVVFDLIEKLNLTKLLNWDLEEE